MPLMIRKNFSKFFLSKTFNGASPVKSLPIYSLAGKVHNQNFSSESLTKLKWATEPWLDK